MKVLPGFVQNSLAPIARADTKKKSSSSTSRDRSDVGSESSRRRSLSLNLGWGAGGENDKATPRESAAETREKRALRRFHEQYKDEEKIASWLAKTPQGPDSNT